MRFAEIPEHNRCKASLLQAVALDKVAHLYIFTDVLGAPSFALALAFATYLNCTSAKEDDACGICFSCTSMSKAIHPDLQFIFPRKSSSTSTEQQADSRDLNAFRSHIQQNPFLTVEAWLSAMDYAGLSYTITRKDVSKVFQQLSLKPCLGKYKVVLLWLPEKLHHSASNALLKTLEEPPEYSVFLLVSANSQSLLPTILSRGQLHYVEPFSAIAIQRLLKDKYGNLHLQRYEEISYLVEGDPYKALQLVEQENPNYLDRFSMWMRSCYSRNFIALNAQAEDFHKLYGCEQMIFFSYALRLIRQLYFEKLNHVRVGEISVVEQAFIKKFSLYVSADQLQEMIGLLNQAHDALTQHAKPKMLYMYLSIQILELFYNPSIE